SSRVRLWSLIKPTTRIESAPISGLRAPFPTSPAAPIVGGSPGGQRPSIASATMSNASSTSSSSTVGSLPATISLAPPSLLSSNSQPCEFGSDQLSPRPSTTLADLLTPLSVADPFSAVRASLRRWSSDEFEDGLADSGQSRLW